MSLQTGSLGRFWLGPQTEKGTAASTFYGYRGSLIDVSAKEILKNLGPMVGGTLVPEGSVKTGAFGGGSAVLMPALDDYIGWLLFGFAGTSSSIAGPEADTYHHYFPQAADDNAPGKYLTGRRKVPGTADLYEQLEDLVPARMVLGIAGGEFTSFRYDVLGRTISSPDGSGWTYTSKDGSTVPTACNGGISVGGSSLGTVTAAVVELNNVIPNIQQVLVIGSHYPYDFPVRARAISATLACLWETKTFYDNFMWDGTAWKTAVYGADLDLYAATAGYVSGTTPYELRFFGETMDWVATPPTLAGGEQVAFTAQGAVKKQASGFDWYVRLCNGTTSYTWPS